ncbi:MAG: translation elongation factor 4 [Chloroflexi bacterium]|nr:translation elongation factor 4 [Chloroflexota bacterium]
MDGSRIRNLCIIAHIDHGKSTLTDRLLEFTGTLSRREMVEQVMDQMDLEREKGITIKAKAVRMLYHARDGNEYELNLIDTPGHVDFTYEVSRALAACEGAVLVVDATQGIEAQTLANLYLALEHNLTIIPVVNKIDLASARPEEVGHDLARLLSVPEEHIIRASAKEGTGTESILEAVVRDIPPPQGDPALPLSALIFDSKYDAYKGVVAYVRVVDGEIHKNEKLVLMSTGLPVEALEVGVFRPKMVADESLAAGEVGYVATGLKSVRDIQVGDTITRAASEGSPAAAPVPGFRPAKPMVFAGFYPVETNDYPLLRDALDKLKLNDASLTYLPETSAALGFGFRCGFLGLLHLEIVQERLEREYDVNLIATAPSVEYRVLKNSGDIVTVDNPAEMPDPVEIAEIEEPWMNIQVFTPKEFIGQVMDLVTARRGEFDRMEYLDEARVMLAYRMPLSELIVDFYDQLKSRTRGYASLDYTFANYRASDLVKLNVLVNEEPVDALSMIVHKDRAFTRGAALARRLKEVIPRQLFPVPIQAAMGGRIVARETIRAMRKDVLAKCYGGDITRKRKLLEKQKKGKKRMKRFGTIEIPQEAFMAVLKLGEEE